MRKLIWVALVCAAPASAQERFTLADLARLVNVREPEISPDGKRVLYVLSKPNFRENRTESELWAIDVATREARRLIAGRIGLASPSWARGGDSVAFLARGDSGGSQLFFASARDGGVRQVTRLAAGVRTFALSPNGERVAYSTEDAPQGREGEERFNDAFEVGNDDFLTMAAPRPVHLWVMGTDGLGHRRLTSGALSLATSLSTSPIRWLPSGDGLIVQVFATPHSGDTDKSRLARVAVADGALTYLTSESGRASGPDVSPNGDWISYAAPRDGVPANQRDLMLQSTGGGRARNVSRTLDRAVSATWLPNGEMLWTAPNETRIAMWRADTGGRAQPMPLGDLVSVSSVSVARDGSLAFLGATRNRPDEVYLWSRGAAAPTRLTDLNAFLEERATSRTIGITWPTTDGLTADGVATYPPGFDSSRQYPLVMYIHGGPTASSHEGFSTRVALLAAQGWIVFQPNYRGSDNRGNAFQRAIADNPGPGIEADVMGGYAELVRRGGVDTTRVGVSGWSFGGYVSAWLIGHKQWKAAIVGAGAMDLYDMYALTDLNVQLRHAITASPYTAAEREAFFIKHSPLTYASQVRTPTLILHDVRDQRVTITQSYKLYHALKDNQVPVQFIAYPIAGHSPTDPVRSRDVHRRWIEWFARHFAPPTP